MGALLCVLLLSRQGLYTTIFVVACEECSVILLSVCVGADGAAQKQGRPHLAPAILIANKKESPTYFLCRLVTLRFDNKGQLDRLYSSFGRQHNNSLVLALFFHNTSEKRERQNTVLLLLVGVCV